MFYNHSIVIDDEVLKQYSKEWKKPALQKDLDRYDNVSKDSRDTEAQMLFQPRGAQIEALYALKNSRREGADKGLVYAATGVGKTYLAAFDSAGFEKVLFVAHREEILRQTKEAINHAMAAGVPIVFAINKVDKPTANPDKIKEELAAMNYLVEEWGGKYQSQDISAKKGMGVEDRRIYMTGILLKIILIIL